MLGWSEGQFELWQAEVEGRDELRQRTAFLVMEGLRRQDEARGGGSAGEAPATTAVDTAELNAAFAEF
jgi:hypothetical protein